MSQGQVDAAERELSRVLETDRSNLAALLLLSTIEFNRENYAVYVVGGVIWNVLPRARSAGARKSLVFVVSRAPRHFLVCWLLQLYGCPCLCPVHTTSVCCIAGVFLPARHSICDRPLTLVLLALVSCYALCVVCCRAVNLCAQAAAVAGPSSHAASQYAAHYMQIATHSPGE